MFIPGWKPEKPHVIATKISAWVETILVPRATCFFEWHLPHFVDYVTKRNGGLWGREWVETWVWACALKNIQRNKMAAMEKLCLNQGWNSPCNSNTISAEGVGWNFSPGWNLPCNHPLRERRLLHFRCNNVNQTTKMHSCFWSRRGGAFRRRGAQYKLYSSRGRLCESRRLLDHLRHDRLNK